MRIIEPKFEIGQIVYCKTDKSQEERLITSILVTQNEIKYECTGTTRWHYDFELSSEINVLKQISE